MTVCYLLTRTRTARVIARVYTDPPTSGLWTCDAGFHSAEVEVDVIDVIEDDDGYLAPLDPAEARGQWPTLCDDCGADLPDDALRLAVQRGLWTGPDSRVGSLDEFGPGAMWDAWWLPWKGPDGLCLAVKCPDGAEWQIDGPARNCTRPGEPHKCWVRHGTPPRLTVDKNGDTCKAGGGSIQTPGYHGFLRAGRFVRA